MSYLRALQAVRNAPSKPHLTDSYDPTNPTLWDKVLMVARGDLREMTRVGPNGPRTIHAPNHGLGYRHWPNPRAVAWAVKQYNGYGGRWKSPEKETVVTAASKSPTGWMGFRVPRDTSQVLKQFDVPGTPEDVETLHTTLIYMGETSLQTFCEAVEALYPLVSGTEPLHLSTRRVTCFSKGDDGVPIICDVESADLHEISKAVRETLDMAEIEYNKKYPVYKPHVCLAYAKEPIQDIEFDPIEWTVNSLDFWLGHNGEAMSVKIPFKNGFRAGDRISSTRHSLQDALSIFKTVWRFKTEDHR